MAFLVSGRDDEATKLRAFPLVLREGAKAWYQTLAPEERRDWETLKTAFIEEFRHQEPPEEIWRQLLELRQTSPNDYRSYEGKFSNLWEKWCASLGEGERAPECLKKDCFLAGLYPILREKVKVKFPDTFEKAMAYAREKDRKLKFQAQLQGGMEPPPPAQPIARTVAGTSVTDQESSQQELLQQITNQLESLSINLVQGVRAPQSGNDRNRQEGQRQPREYVCYNCGEVGHGMYFCPHPRRYQGNGNHRRAPRQQVTPPRARPPNGQQNAPVAPPIQILRPPPPPPQTPAEIPPLPSGGEDRAVSVISMNEASVLSGHAELPSYATIVRGELVGKPYDLPASSNANPLTIRLADGCSKAPRCVFSALECVKLQRGPSEHPSASRITIRFALELAGNPYDFPTRSNAIHITKGLVDGCSKGPHCVFSALDCVKLQRGPFEHTSASRITIGLALELAGKPYDLPINSNASRLTIRLAVGCSEGPRCVFSALDCVKLQREPYEHPSARRINIRLALELVGKPYDLPASTNANRLTIRLADGCSEGRIIIRLALELAGKPYDLLASSNARRLTIVLADGYSKLANNPYNLPTSSNASWLTIRLADGCSEDPRCVFSALDCVKLQRGSSEHPSANLIAIQLALEVAGKPYDLPSSSNANRNTKRLADGCSKGPRCVFSALDCVKL
ncbi:hypothetical protein L7F22_053320 [Adiantum nelumboides]|nr:hypothetical protein [Adiantum nelumboides]